MTARTALGVAFLGAQIALALASPLGHDRSFRWAPHTTQVRYQLDVTVNGHRLSPRAARDRFGLVDYGWEAHAASHLQNLIAQHGRTYGAGEDVHVTLRYRINDGEERTWVWSSR